MSAENMPQTYLTDNNHAYFNSTSFVKYLNYILLKPNSIRLYLKYAMVYISIKHT